MITFEGSAELQEQLRSLCRGLKGSGPYFLNGLVYEICEIYIDDVLIHGKTDPDFLTNTR
jgi:hypothetical protein